MNANVQKNNNVLTPAKQMYRALKKFYSTAMGLTPALHVNQHNYNFLKMGSAYGGWSFIDTDALKNSTIISCGLGEDASFDVEFAARFNAKVVIVDPTPRAINHFKEIAENLGNKASRPYVDGGNQPIDAYELSNIKPANLVFYDKALWNESKTLRFFTPPNPDHVSHSIVNFQNNYRTDSDYIEVEAVTIDVLMRDLAITNIALMKLNIEGAEIEVILDMMEKKVFPTQILIQYDELQTPSKVTTARVKSAHNALLKNGYQLLNFEKTCNYLYARSPLTV